MFSFVLTSFGYPCVTRCNPVCISYVCLSVSVCHARMSAFRIGQRITEDERRALVEKYKVILSTDSLNAFLERLPRDMLFVIRTSDLVRSLNKVRRVGMAKAKAAAL